MKIKKILPALFLSAVCAFGQFAYTQADTTVNTQTATPKVYASGKYETGKDIPYGVYVFTADNDDTAEVNLISSSENFNVKKVFTDQYIVEIAEDKENKSAFFKTSPYMENKYPRKYNTLELVNCHATPSAQLDKQDIGYNGVYRVGKDIASGKYTFTKADGCSFAYIKLGKNKLLTENKLYIVDKPISLTLNKNSEIKIINCNINQYGTITEHKSKSAGNTENADMSKVNSDLKRKISADTKNYLTEDFLKEEKRKDIEEKNKKAWASLAKTDEDKKYIDIVTKAVAKADAFDSYYSSFAPVAYESGILTTYLYPKTDRSKRDEQLSLDEQKRANRMLRTQLRSCFSRLISASTFDEMQSCYMEMNDYMCYAGWVEDFVGNTVLYSEKNNYWN